MPKIPTIAVAGLWSAITIVALSIVALDHVPRGESAATTAGTTLAMRDPVAAAPIVLTDATGNRYRKRRD